MSMESTSFSFNLNSHPDKLLIEHLRNVGTMAREIVNSKHIDNKDVFSEVAFLIGVSHDFGKATTYFQKWLKGNERKKCARHSPLSALFGYFLVKDYLESKDQSKRFWFLPGIVWIVISKHHSNIRNLMDREIGQLLDPSETELAIRQLEDMSENCLGELRRMYRDLGNIDILEFFKRKHDVEKLRNSIFRDIREIIKTSFRNELPSYYFHILFFYSILLDADKLDASGRSKLPKRMEIASNIIDEYKKEKFKGKLEKINILREKAYNETISNLSNLDIEADRILSMNLPTGAGKTLTGLSLAVKMRNRIYSKMGFLPRIIYTLPFLSIIDQNAEQIEEILKIRERMIPSNLFLKHHHLSDIEYKEEIGDELRYEDFNRSLLLTEGWHSEIVITTFIQLFNSLITNKNSAARKFHNMTNSIIILDEVQAIPPKFWCLIRTALKYLAYCFNSWIILMTATQPLIFSPDETREIVPNKMGYFEALDRVGYTFYLEKREFNDFKRILFEEILKNDKKSYMVVLNTVKSCKDLYEYLKKEFCKENNLDSSSAEILDEDGICRFPSFSLVILSTHVLPRHRLERIRRIKFKGPNERIVVISTQVVEAGVDIDVDVVYRDMAPLDCIVQAGGRCNRNNIHERGEVNIVNLTKGGKQFWSYIYDPVLINATLEAIKRYPEEISENRFVIEAMGEYYRQIIERISENTSQNIVESMKKLNFSDMTEFRLIEEKLGAVSILVEINNEAKRIREQMEEIIATKKGFERKIEIKKIRKRIGLYTIHTYLKDELKGLKHIRDFDDYFYVEKEKLDKWYRKDTGIHLESENP
jgi:CRISPR-associated endonuclease/helicase Cas3